MTKQKEIIETAKNQAGFPIRLQKRGRVFDVVYCTGFCWKYVRGGKAVSELEAQNVFFLETVKIG